MPVSGSEVKLTFEPSERFRPVSEYRDKPFAILFLLHLVVFLGLFIFAAVYYADLPPSDTVTNVRLQRYSHRERERWASVLARDILIEI